MEAKIYKNQDIKKQERKISSLFLDVYLNKNKKLFKNYILEPNEKLIDC